jgi:hypothetical protein
VWFKGRGEELFRVFSPWSLYLPHLFPPGVGARQSRTTTSTTTYHARTPQENTTPPPHIPITLPLCGWDTIEYKNQHLTQDNVHIHHTCTTSTPHHQHTLNPWYINLQHTYHYVNTTHQLHDTICTVTRSYYFH